MLASGESQVDSQDSDEGVSSPLASYGRDLKTQSMDEIDRSTFDDLDADDADDADDVEGAGAVGVLFRRRAGGNGSGSSLTRTARVLGRAGVLAGFPSGIGWDRSARDVLELVDAA